MSLSIRSQLKREGPEGFRLDVDLKAPAAGITALFGPSGCGKSTLLRCLAGLEPQATGEIRVGNQVWQDERQFLAPHRRRTGYVFQDGALFPHLDVRGNLLFGMKRRAPVGVDFEETVALLGLGPLLNRRTLGLSGGERQRVALGRALLSGPQLLLCDEPLASLDRESRRAIFPTLERIGAAAGIPLLYVTHDIDEAARLADHLVLMHEGRILHSGPLTAMLTSPAPGLGHGANAGCVVTARIESVDPADHLSRLAFSGGFLLVPDPGLPIASSLRVRIHARDVSLALEPPGGTSILNILPARVVDLTPEGPARVLVRLAVGDTTILAAVTQRSAATLQLAPGADIFAQIKSVALL